MVFPIRYLVRYNTYSCCPKYSIVLCPTEQELAVDYAPQIRVLPPLERVVPTTVPADTQRFLALYLQTAYGVTLHQPVAPERKQAPDDCHSFIKLWEVKTAQLIYERMLTTAVEAERQRQEQERQTQLARSAPDQTTLATTLKLLALKNIGPQATLAILNDLQTRAFQWKDIKATRRQRYYEKLEPAEPEPAMPDGILAYYASDEYKAKAAQPQVSKQYHEAEDELEQYFGMHPMVADFDRDIYCTIASYLSPYGIAAMVGVSHAELMNNMKYRDIRFAVYCMLPPIANPFGQEFA